MASVSEEWSIINRLDNNLKPHQRERYWLSTCVLTFILHSPSLSFQEMYQQVRQKLGTELATGFTYHILKERSNYGQVEDLVPFTSPNFHFDASYPEVDLCLTVADYFNLMDDSEYHSVRGMISVVHLGEKDVSGFNRVEFVFHLFKSDIITPGNVSKIEDPLRYPRHYTNYKEKYKRLFPNGIETRQSQGLSDPNPTICTEESNQVFPDGRGVVLPTEAPPTNDSSPSIVLIAKKRPQPKHLLGKLDIIQERWKDLSYALGVPVPNKDNSENDFTNLGRVIESWLRREGHRATWESIFYVLESTMKEQSAADELKLLLEDEEIFEEYMNN